MTSSLIDEIASAPDEPVEDDWGQPQIDAADAEPPKRKRGRPRKPREIDPATGKEIPAPKRTYTPRSGKLKEELLEPYVELAANLAIVAPTVSGVLIIRAEKTVDGMVDLASGHPRVLNALKKVGKASKGADLVETVLLVMVAAMVDTGRIDPASPLLDRLGHSEIAKDDRGNAVKDGNKLVKNRTSLRDIYNSMHPEGQEVVSDGPPPPPDGWETPRTPSGPINFVPMNNRFVEPGQE